MKNDRIYQWLKKYAPPGIQVSTGATLYVVGIVLGTLHSMMFLLVYMNELSNLYEYRAGQRVLIEDAMIPGFDTLTEGRFLIFYGIVEVLILVIGYHYFYHYQGSKMMYLMKRLPDKWEVHRRCLTLPILGSLVAMFYMNVLRALYFAIYIFCTPPQCLPL